MSYQAAYHFLLIDDNQVDINATEAMLQSTRYLRYLHIVKSKETAVAYLKRQGPFSKAKQPDIIFLSIYRSDSKGIGLLKWIKSDPEINHIPVVVLTAPNTNTDSLHPSIVIA